MAASEAATPGPVRTLSDVVPTAATGSHSSAMAFWPVAVVVLLGGLTGFVVVRRRRAHGMAGADGGTDHSDHPAS